MLLLTFRDLQHRITRFVVVTLVTAVVFSLLFLMNGLVEQFHREPEDTTNSFAAQQWALAAGVAGPFTSSASVPADAFAETDTDASPFVIARGTLHDGSTSQQAVIVGHVPGAMGSPRIVKGRPISARNEVVVDKRADVKVGSSVTIDNTVHRVVGLSAKTTVLSGLPLVFVELSDAQDMIFRSRQVVSGFLLSTPRAEAPNGLRLASNEDVAQDTFGPIENAVTSIDLVRALLWLVAAIVIGAVVYLSALERQRDFAVLKAVGATNAKLAVGLALQASVVALVGVLIASGLQLLLRPAFPLPIQVPSADYWRLPILAVVVALLAAAVGMRRVVRADPAAAFAGA